MNRRAKNFFDQIDFEDPFFDITRKERRQLRKEFIQDLAEFLGEWELFIVDGKIWAAGYFTTPEGKLGYDEVCLGPRVRGKEAEE